jgi:hypothetical protein
MISSSINGVRLAAPINPILIYVKNQAQMGYVPARRLVANKVYLLCTLFAHNLSRELQMQVEEPVRGTTERRTVKWLFEELDTLRREPSLRGRAA